ncbi:MAG TPA: hypothetical protein VI029_16890 [Mycobacterium sp.]
MLTNRYTANKVAETRIEMPGHTSTRMPRVAMTETAPAELRSRDLSGLDVAVS